MTRAGDSLKNGALIGAGVGALTVLAVVIADDADQVDTAVSSTGCKVGASVFAMAAYHGHRRCSIDRAIKGRTVVYRAPADRVSWSVTPHPVPRRRGRPGGPEVLNRGL